VNLWVPRELHDSIRPERVLAIMAFGYSERQARFLVHVLVHSGVFLERQYCLFAGIAHGQKTHDFLHKLIERKHVTVMTPGAFPICSGDSRLSLGISRVFVRCSPATRPAQVADSGRNTLPEQIGNAPRSISHRRRAAAVRAVCTRGIPSVTRARMSPRNTTTGAVLENMIIPALDRGGYAHVEQFNIGTRLGGGRHIIDVLAEQDGRRLLVSLKWQQSSGTAEQKVPFEAICLAECLRSDARFARGAYLVLGGEGWTLRSFYVGGGLQHHLVHADKVNIMTLEAFVALANRGEL
jgi:hypothetical protein